MSLTIESPISTIALPPGITIHGRIRRQDRLLIWLSIAYGAVWCVTAIKPHDRRDWLLENVLVAGFVGLLAGTRRKFPFSRRSYVFMTIFLTLHSIGAHYTYANTPVGFWLQKAWGLRRNHYDRIVHFAFGLLLADPARELFRRAAGVRGPWQYYHPIAAVGSLSAIYEIVEAGTAEVVNPKLGDAYLGSQGDAWDSQKDMLAAFIGAGVAMLLAWLFGKRSAPAMTVEPAGER